MMGSLSINSQQILILYIWSWKLDNYIPEFKKSNILDMCSIPGKSLDFHILQPKKKKSYYMHQERWNQRSHMPQLRPSVAK